MFSMRVHEYLCSRSVASGLSTAAGLAALGHRVIGFDFDDAIVTDLSKGIAPISEPGLEELIKRACHREFALFFIGR